MKLLIMQFPPPPVTSSLFGPNILLNTLFSNTLSLCSSLNVRDQVSHPYRRKDKIIVLYILIFVFSDRTSYKYRYEEALMILCCAFLIIADKLNV
jgi:hypothetical protein